MNKKILWTAISLIIFLVVAFLYCSPVLSGKTLSMHDVNMASGSAKELEDFHKSTGQWAWWTNSMFGGMPGFMIAGEYPNSLISKLGGFITGILPIPVNVFFLLMLGFYILMYVSKSNKWVAIACSIGYAFGTYNLLYTEAGHISKILALAFAPPILAGIMLAFRGKYLQGALMTAIFTGLELYANHLQITYYFIFIILAFGIYKIIELVKAGEVANLGKIIASLLLGAFLGIASHTMRLWNNLTYSKETTRGKSELIKTTAGKDGLDKDYAFGWSYGINETYNLIIPNFMGGGSAGSLDQDSETFKTLTSGGVDGGQASQLIQQLPLYFGTQSYTTGPAYMGVCLVFLMILGLFMGGSKWEYVNFGLTFMFIIFAWGSNFDSFNSFIFNNLPGYNKFRAVTMTLTIAQFLIVWGAALSLNNIVKNELGFDKIKKPLTYALGTLGILMLLGYFMLSYSGPNDGAFKDNLAQSIGPEFAQKVLNSMISDRGTMVMSDLVRSILLMLLVAALIWAYSTHKIKQNVFGGILILLVVFDLFSVGKRYFNNKDFVSKFDSKAGFEPNAANQLIMNDPDPDFRVINSTTSFWADATDSYFHKSIGGYHAGKLKIIQELYENQMVKNGNLNLPILDMLNTKYFIVNDPKAGPVAQQNPNAFGNAWFVDTLKVVPNADLELQDLSKVNLRKTAVVQNKFIAKPQILKSDAGSSIKLTSYKPNELIYESNNTQEGFGVFSEIYYRGNQDWISSIDNKIVPHVKVDYVLRGMNVPSGKHTIKFEFKPQSVEKGKIGDLIGSVGIVLLAGLVIFQSVKRSKEAAS